jgi:hypothetical protein
MRFENELIFTTPPPSSIDDTFSFDWALSFELWALSFVL